MNVYEKLKQEKLEARKVKDTDTIASLTYLQGEIERQYKNPDDSKVIPLLRSIEKKLSENEAQNLVELTILRSFLNRNAPKLLSRLDIHDILETHDIQHVGEAMKYLKETYPNQYEPAEVAALYRERKG